MNSISRKAWALSLVATWAAFAPWVQAAELLVPPGASLSMNGGVAGLQCANLGVQGTVSLGSATHGIAGNVTIGAGGTLNANSGTLNVGANWSNAGTFNAGTGTVAFVDGCTTAIATLTGVNNFNNLTLVSAVGRNFLIPQGVSTNVSGTLTVMGAAGLPITILSALPSQPTFITVGSGGSITNTNTTLGTNVFINGGPNPTRLVNLSTRMQVLTGNDVMIGGFVVGSGAPKRVVVRARGPSLVAAGITNALANPTLQLLSGASVLAINDDWGSSPDAAAISASGFAPSSPSESAILATLNPGAYTAIVSGVGGTTGVGIFEAFEVDQPATPLANLSTRGQVLTGNDVMIGGFVIQGTTPQTVVIRARGPSLVPFGITNALPNPFLQLLSGASVLAANDDWGASPDAAAISASGFAPAHPLESAMLVTLSPGAYTVVVSGTGGVTGVGIVEVFAQ